MTSKQKKLSGESIHTGQYIRIVSYRIVSYRIVSYRIVSYRIVSYRIVSYRIVSYRIVSYRIVSYRIVSYRIVSYRIVSYRIVSYRIVSYRSIPGIYPKTEENVITHISPTQLVNLRADVKHTRIKNVLITKYNFAYYAVIPKTYILTIRRS